MENINSNYQEAIPNQGLTLGHLGIVFATILLLLGISWMKNPALFAFHKNQQPQNFADVPRYYAYVSPAEDAQPLVAGANTNDVASLINEDGSVSPVDMGQVLGASTEDVVLSLDDVKVKTFKDSPEAIQKYFADTQSIENGPIDGTEFEAALSSGNQSRIDSQVKTMEAIKNNLQSLSVPESLAKLHKLKIIQFASAIGVLQNFTKADESPELVGKYLQEFLKSQQDLDTESAAVQQKYNLTDAQLFNAQQ
ncbi:MAG: hypothetical protein HY918_02085 [Candidatus Doudnabacteria bacterium]|nr:hypothetical protein [Candidatus Doudnabacteria bacterium]